MRIDVMRQLVRTILEGHEHHKWSLQGFGMLRLYLSKELRLHVWDTRYRVPGVSAIHDHPWDFESTVISGQITNVIYEENDTLGGVYKKNTIQCGPGGCQITEPELARLLLRGGKTYSPGDSYGQTAAQIHNTIPTNGAVTLVRRIFTRKDTETAHVYWQQGDWISAEPRDARPDEVRDIVLGALDRWDEQ